MIDYNIYYCGECGEDTSRSAIKPRKCRICHSANIQPLYQWFDPMDWNDKELEETK